MFNQFSCQEEIDASVQLFESEKEIAICGGILQFRSTNQEQPKLIFAPRNRETEISKAVDENSKKIDKKRTVMHRWIKISWHLLCAICLLRKWVSEWESTSIERENAFWSCVWDWQINRDSQGIVKEWTLAGGRPKGAVKLRATDRDEEMNRHDSNEPEQMLRING